MIVKVKFRFRMALALVLTFPLSDVESRKIRRHSPIRMNSIQLCTRNLCTLEYTNYRNINIDNIYRHSV